ncbi:Histidine--tRNA ligase [compost metagenome]
MEKQEIEIGGIKPLDVYFVALGEAADKEITTLMYKLRQEGFSAERDYLGRKMKAQMKSAERMQARYTAILGDDELECGEIALKLMETGEQRTVKLSDLASELK